MWGKCVSCGEGLFAGDSFCGNCGRPTTPAVPAARAPEGSETAPAEAAPAPSAALIRIHATPAAPEAAAGVAGPAAPARTTEPGDQPQLDLGLALEPTVADPADPDTPVADTLAEARPEDAARPGPEALAGPDDGLPEPVTEPADQGEPDAPGVLRIPAPAGPGQPAPGGPGQPAPGGPSQPAPGGPSQPAPGGPGQPAPGTGLHPVPAQQAGRGLRRTRLTGQANPDPAGNARVLLRVLRQAAVFAGIYVLVETVQLIVFLVLGFARVGLPGAFRLETQSLWIAALALATVFWVIPVPALLGQWAMLVENHAETAGVTFGHIALAFREHDAPLDFLEVCAVSPRGESVRDYLELRRGRFSGFISCFPHGRDLYVGWTFFLRMSPARLILMSIARGDIRRTLWFESSRALVAAMHSAVMTGIDSLVSAPGPAGAGGDSADDDALVRFG